MYLIFILISFLFLLIFSYSTSPLYPNLYAYDSAIFQMLGKFFNAGKTPYVDFFDHKGPIIIFINALGEYIYPDGRIGIFILQVINLTLIQIIAYKMSKLYLLSNSNCLVINILFLIYFVLTIGEGNLTEEYSLLFTTLTLYITLKQYLDTSNKQYFISNIMIGVGLAFSFWLRLNNMGVSCACIIFLIILFLSKKDWITLKQFILDVFIGFLLLSIPIFIYFLYKKAFFDLIYASLIFNFKYAQLDRVSAQSLLNKNNIIGIIPFLVLAIGTYFSYKQDKSNKILLLSFLLILFGVLTTFIGPGYAHYYTLNIPLLLFGCIFILSYIWKYYNKFYYQKTLFVLLSLLIILLCIRERKIIRNAKEYTNIQLVNEINNKIPDLDKNSVYTYGVYQSYIPSFDFLPCYKYFILQEWHSIADPNILTSINNMLKQNSPKWIVTYNKRNKEKDPIAKESINTDFWNILKSRYSLYYENNLFDLYKLN